jgi:superfamily II DNA/RNA helicase
MERSLDPRLLDIALGQHDTLPSAVTLAQLLTQAELSILSREADVSEELRAIGWYLHGVASSRVAQELYGLERQRAAFQVAGHIFDLYLRAGNLADSDRLKYCFAAQIAYLRAGLTPNALAIYRREAGPLPTDIDFIRNHERVALWLGVALLGFNVGYVFTASRGIISETNQLVRIWEIEAIAATPFAAAAGVVSGVRDIMSFLVYGKQDLLNRARSTLRDAITADASLQDYSSRWVAAHLLNIGDSLEQSSIWTVLPPEVPSEVRRAFVAGTPRVLTLWPTQLELLGIRGTHTANPLSAQVRRLIVSTPTSGGKTTVSQLLIASHLATESTSVCYVAPTRALCREVRKGLEQRLRFLSHHVVDGLPEDSPWDAYFAAPPSVEVMTPERLAHQIRLNPSKVLDIFGLFVFDEVHLIGEPSRGWTLESVLTFLHHATAESNHRIVLISAVIGNRNHFIQWMSLGESEPFETHSDWRGPRRMNAIFTTEADWKNAKTFEDPRARLNRVVQHVPLFGQLHVRVSHSGEIRELRSTEQVGILVRKGADESNLEKSNDSTPFYRSLIPLITHLAESGPVLVIEPTKAGTLRTAKAIAESRLPDTRSEIIGLAELIETHMGRHPLIDLVSRGVAYHHGSLPSDMRVAIEDATSRGLIHVLVATTTMTEGVNLPVQSVVISAQGGYGPDGFREYITGPKLVNAIGRAGRATKETEGIVVLARNATFDPADFNRLSPGTDETRILSMLAQEYALKALADYESELRYREDAVFEIEKGPIADFLQFAWFVASELERIGSSAEIGLLQDVLQKSLAWAQLGEQDKSRWLALVDTMLQDFRCIPQSARRRWAKSGLAIGSARQIELLAVEMTDVLAIMPLPAEPVAQIAAILDGRRLERLLALGDAPTDQVFTTRAGRGRMQIPISCSDLIDDWMRGTSLTDLAEKYLSDATDIDFRYEQLGQYLNTYIETYLPHVLAILIQWTNELCAERNQSVRISLSLTDCLRFGVNSALAASLMVGGLQLRTVAQRVASIAPPVFNVEEIRDWLRTMEISRLCSLFCTSPFELRNLVEFARPRTGGVAFELIRSGTVLLELPSYVHQHPLAEAKFHLSDHNEFSPIEILVSGVQVAVVPDPYRKEILDILDSGFEIKLVYSAESTTGLLRIDLLDPDDHG